MGVLIKVDWALWGVLAIVAAYALLKMATERSGPEGRGLGGLAVVMILVLLGGAALGVRAAAKRQSLVGLILMAVVLVWPLVAFIADTTIKARRAARYESHTSSG
jgi:hypothetical protein